MKNRLLKEIDRRIAKIEQYDYTQWKPSEMGMRQIINNNLKAELKGLRRFVLTDRNIFQRICHYTKHKLLCG